MVSHYKSISKTGYKLVSSKMAEYIPSLTNDIHTTYVLCGNNGSEKMSFVIFSSYSVWLYVYMSDKCQWMVTVLMK